MSWSYRVVKYVDDIEDLYFIKEVSQDKNGNIVGISDKSYITSTSLDDLKWILNKMVKCCYDNPVVDYEDFKLKSKEYFSE